MERPKPKMRLWKRVLRHAGTWVGTWFVFHVILVITRSVV